MTSVKPLLGLIVLGLGLSASAFGQGDANDGANGQSDAQLAQRFNQLDTNGDGVLSLAEFRQIRGENRGNGQDRGERMGQMTPEQREQMRERMQSMTPEQREQMRERMQNMTPEQRERMQEQMRERRGQERGGHNGQGGQGDQAGAEHDHGEP